MKARIELVKGDITTEDVDIIVNAAKKTLTGGGGVDGAIHSAAGSKLAHECSKLYGCETGQARMTAGYNLLAKYVVHTVGPVWPVGDKEKQKEAELALRASYFSCLTFALLQGVKSIAFPCISTGVFMYPKDKAAEVAFFSVNWFLRNHETDLDFVRFVCFDDENHEAYKVAAESHGLNFRIND